MGELFTNYYDFHNSKKKQAYINTLKCIINHSLKINYIFLINN